jgi:rhodanese-related sulfurtransferase
VRSLSAAEYLRRLGHADVCSLAGGIDAWSCAVDPTLPRY